LTQDQEAIKRAQKAITDLKAELENLQRITNFLEKENEDKTKAIQVKFRTWACSWGSKQMANEAIGLTRVMLP